MYYFLIIFKSKENEIIKQARIETQAQHESIKEYARKLEAHYKLKKEEFSESQKEAIDKINSQHVEIRTLREELNCFKEKINTIKYENQQLTIQKDCATKKLLLDESLAFSYQQNKIRDSNCKFLPVKCQKILNYFEKFYW